MSDPPNTSGNPPAETPFEQTVFTGLFREVYPHLHWYVRQWVDAPDAAEDLIQEAFLRLWERRARLDPQRSVRSLLFVTVRNLAHNHQRNTRTRENLKATVLPPVPVPTPDVAFDALHLSQQLEVWIARLPDRQREAFQLSRFAGLSHREIADVMDLSVLTVEKHITTALRRLRDRVFAFDPSLLR